METKRPSSVGWYAVYVPLDGGAAIRRVVFCFPGRRGMVAEVREDEPKMIPLSDPYFAGATFAGPFGTREEAAVAAKTLRP